MRGDEDLDMTKVRGPQSLGHVTGTEERVEDTVSASV